jgi:hypothetical protein
MRGYETSHYETPPAGKPKCSVHPQFATRM